MDNYVGQTKLWQIYISGRIEIPKWLDGIDLEIYKYDAIFANGNYSNKTIDSW